MEELKLNDIVYFSHGSQTIKCVVEEIINHYTQKELIKKIIIRFYGMKDFHTVEEKDIFKTFAEAKINTRKIIKENILKLWQNFKEIDEEYCDAKEVKYQEELNKGEIKNGLSKEKK